MLLVDYLEDAAQFLKAKKERLQELNRLNLKIYDRGIKKEMVEIKKEISKKTSEIYETILLNLEEFQAIHKYYPQLLEAFVEDEDIGKIIAKKIWLVHFRSLPPREAAMRLDQVRKARAELRHAAKFVRGWAGPMDSRALISKYPLLKGHLEGEVDKHDVLAAIERVDKAMLKEGWFILLSDSLIHIPIAKFMTKVNEYRIQEMQAAKDLQDSHGRGTVMETAALRKYQDIQRRRMHYEKMVKQILLANPGYLRQLKRKKHWLSRERQGNLDKIVAELTPHRIKERAWLDQMKKRLEK